LADQLEGRTAQLERAQRDVLQRQQELQDAVSSVYELAGRERQDWVMAEVEYLLLVANHRLQLAEDVDTAIAASTYADQRLRELGDPALLPIREQLAREIQTLKAVERPDINGLAVRLSGLSEQAERLPLAATHPRKFSEVRAQANGETGTPAASGWRKHAEAVWSELKTLVVIRRHDKPVRPMLSPVQERLTREVLRMKLEVARLALLEQDAAEFRAALQDAQSWLQDRFDLEDAAVSSVRLDLDNLAAADVELELPDISRSLRLVRQHNARVSAAARPSRHGDGARAATGTAATDSDPPKPQSVVPLPARDEIEIPEPTRRVAPATQGEPQPEAAEAAAP
jgi:uroporphyrin-3 C-methyltransferase